MTHTPGPWFVASNHDDGGVLSDFGRMRDSQNDEAECILGGGDDYQSPCKNTPPGPRVICWTQMNETPEGGDAITDEDRANANLIAAAPELLAASKCALADLMGMSDLVEEGHPCFATIEELQAAIVKAEGRE